MIKAKGLGFNVKCNLWIATFGWTSMKALPIKWTWKICNSCSNFVEFWNTSLFLRTVNAESWNMKFTLPATILPRMKLVLGTDAYLEQMTMKKFSSAKYPVRKIVLQNNTSNRTAIKLITENNTLTLKRRKGIATVLKKGVFSRKKHIWRTKWLMKIQNVCLLNMFIKSLKEDLKKQTVNLEFNLTKNS